MKKQMHVLVLISLLFVSCFLSDAHAVFLIDTGTPPTSTGGIVLAWTQFLAGRMDIRQNYTVNTIQGWMGIRSPGIVELAIYKGSVVGAIPDIGLIPNTENEILRESFFLSPNGNVNDWYGTEDLNLFLTPGDYWFAFEPPADSSFEGWLPTPAPHPLSDNAFDAIWNEKYIGQGSSLALGFRVEASSFGIVTPSVPITPTTPFAPNSPLQPLSPTSPNLPDSPQFPTAPQSPFAPTSVSGVTALSLLSDQAIHKDIPVVANPEPASLFLLGGGLVVALIRRRRTIHNS